MRVRSVSGRWYNVNRWQRKHRTSSEPFFFVSLQIIFKAVNGRKNKTMK